MSQFINKDINHRHILVIPAWMPVEADPAAGMFILEQAIALRVEGKVQVGMIYQSMHPPTNEAIAILDQHKIPYVVHRIPYLPKVGSFLIKLWCRRYYGVYLDYVDKFGPPDILHAHSYIAGFAAAWISERTGIPFVLTEHSTNFPSNTIRKYHRSAIRNTFDTARCVVAVGVALKQALTTWTKRPLLCLPNPVDASVFFQDDTPKNTGFTIVSVGSLIPRKRVEILIQAIALCNDINLIVVGSGPEEQRLKRLAMRLNVSTAITWISYLSSHDLARVLRRAHVLVSTSKTETSGIAVTEAMMCGLPVICTTSGGPEEYVHPEQGIILSKTVSPAGIADAIRGMQRTYTQYHGNRIASYASALFSRSAIIPGLLRIYQEVLSDRQT